MLHHIILALYSFLFFALFLFFSVLVFITTHLTHLRFVRTVNITHTFTPSPYRLLLLLVQVISGLAPSGASTFNSLTEECGARRYSAYVKGEITGPAGVFWAEQGVLPTCGPIWEVHLACPKMAPKCQFFPRSLFSHSIFTPPLF